MKERFLVLIGIQARYGSTRFPEKILHPIKGKPMIHHVIDVCLKAGENYMPKVFDIQTAVLFCEHDAKDKPALNYRGVREGMIDSQNGDLLGRYVIAANDIGADAVIRITSDCPMVEPSMIQKVILELCEHDYVTNTMSNTFVDGSDVQGCTKKFLDWYASKILKEEHLFQTFEQNKMLRDEAESVGMTYQSLVNAAQNIPNRFHKDNKMSVDTKEDISRIEKMMDLYERAAN